MNTHDTFIFMHISHYRAFRIETATLSDELLSKEVGPSSREIATDLSKLQLAKIITICHKARITSLPYLIECPLLFDKDKMVNGKDKRLASIFV